MGCVLAPEFSSTLIPDMSFRNLPFNPSQPPSPDIQDGVNNANAPREDVVRIHSYLSDSLGKAAAEVQIIIYRSHLIV